MSVRSGCLSARDATAWLSQGSCCRGLDIKPDYANVASVVFSSPQVAQVGINEDKAVEEYGDVDIFTSTFSWVPNALHAPPAVVLGEQDCPHCEECLDSVLVLVPTTLIVASAEELNVTGSLLPAWEELGWRGGGEGHAVPASSTHLSVCFMLSSMDLLSILFSIMLSIMLFIMLSIILSIKSADHVGRSSRCELSDTSATASILLVHTIW